MVNPRSKLRERIREATAQAILEAAESVFASEGLHAAKVERIAQGAGVSVGTLYNHFDDREAVLCALVHERQAQLREALDAELARADRPFLAQLQSVLTTVFAQYDLHRPFFSILLQGELETGAQRPRAKAGGARAAMLELRKRLKVLVERGVAAGQIDPAIADLAPTLLLGAIRAVIIRAFLDHDIDAKARVGDLVRFFLHGAGPRHG